MDEDVNVGNAESGVDKNKITWIVLILIGILVLVVVGFVIVNPSFNKMVFRYNGYLIKKSTADGLQYDIFFKLNGNDVNIGVRSDPREVDGIPINDGFKRIILNSSQIYISIDPYANMSSIATLAALEIDKIIDNPYLFAIPVNSAFTRGKGNYTVKTCNDSDDKNTVILLELADKTEVKVKNKCIVVNGKSEDDLVRGADRLVLTLLGIIKD